MGSGRELGRGMAREVGRMGGRGIRRGRGRTARGGLGLCWPYSSALQVVPRQIFFKRKLFQKSKNHYRQKLWLNR